MHSEHGRGPVLIWTLNACFLGLESDSVLNVQKLLTKIGDREETARTGLT